MSCSQTRLLVQVKNEQLHNRPYSYSHGCTGNEHEREADAGKSFQMQIISPAWVSIACSFQSNRENTNKVCCANLFPRVEEDWTLETRRGIIYISSFALRRKLKIRARVLWCDLLQCHMSERLIKKEISGKWQTQGWYSPFAKNRPGIVSFHSIFRLTASCRTRFQTRESHRLIFAASHKRTGA